MPTSGSLPLTLSDIQRAAEMLAGKIVRTPMHHSRTLSAITGAQVWVKFENAQFTASFKERGALVRLTQLSPEERARGVIAMSAGNHAQGVAYHAQQLGIPATIVMPLNTPNTKVLHTREHGATVILHGRTLGEAYAHAAQLRDQHGYTFIHPYNDPHIMAGQGTVALEMLADAPSLDCLVVPVGGGGLIGGMAVAAKGIKPGIQVFGVQTELYPGVKAAMAGEPGIFSASTIAEGIAVQGPGELNLRILRALVDEVLIVPESLIEEAIAMLIEVEKTVVEGAGAAGLAALLHDRERFAGRQVGVVLCGGNMDLRLLASVLTRSLVRQNRLVKIRLMAEDRPGLLSIISRIIGDCRANIIDVLHNRTSLHVPAKGAEFDITLETRDAQHTEEVVRALTDAGFPPQRV